MPIKIVLAKYNQLKYEFNQSALSNNVVDTLKELYVLTRKFLLSLGRRTLLSQIPAKTYFSFDYGKKYSRAVNEKLYLNDDTLIDEFWKQLYQNSLHSISAAEITQACYTIAISFCCMIDLLKERDQKTPGTYYEYFIGCLFSRQFGIIPSSQLEVLNLDMKSKLPTDFIFDLGENNPKFHVPVKTSTRERVVQVWAHQRVLDGVYGTGRFLGLLSCLSETKLDHRTYQVIEICLPDQWRVYQLFIAQLKRIYYLDTPIRYEALNNIFPKIHVKSLGEFFHETDDLSN